MKVLSSELLESNRRERKPGGVYIEFESVENVNKGDYFKVKVDGYNYDFKVLEIKAEGVKLKIKANEVGYWAEKLDEKGVDLRLIVGSDVIPVLDKVEKSRIAERSCWC